MIIYYIVLLLIVSLSCYHYCWYNIITSLPFIFVFRSPKGIVYDDDDDVVDESLMHCTVGIIL